MNWKTLIAMVVVGFPLLVETATAASGSYFGISGYGVYQNDGEIQGSTGLNADISYDSPGWGLAGVFGYGISPNVRLEAEVAYRNYDFDETSVRNDGGLGNALGLGSLNGRTLRFRGDVASLAVMANVYYDVTTAGPWAPYIGGGIGLTSQDAKGSLAGIQVVDDDDSAFAYQLAAGLGYALNDKTTLVLGYRYFAHDDVNFDAVGGTIVESSENDSHNIELGLRWEL